MWLKLANKTAIVTGAGSGIGAAVCVALAEQQCRVVMADTNTKNMEHTAKLCHQHHQESNHTISTKQIKCDVTDHEQVKKLIKDADDFASMYSYSDSIESEVCSMLINCAGMTRDAFVKNMSLDDFDDVIDTNLRSTFLTCKEFCHPQRITSMSNLNMLDGEGEEASDVLGSVVNVGSVVSTQGNIGQVNYGASKGGVIGLTKCLAKEMAPHHIRVNAVLPGFIDTEMTRKVPEKIRNNIKKKVSLNKFGQPADVANLILFLASHERSRYITGECIECSGMISL